MSQRGKTENKVKKRRDSRGLDADGSLGGAVGVGKGVCESVETLSLYQGIGGYDINSWLVRPYDQGFLVRYRRWIRGFVYRSVIPVTRCVLNLSGLYYKMDHGEYEVQDRSIYQYHQVTTVV